MIDLGDDVTGNGISKLVFTILSAVAENEPDLIRERVRDAKRHRASQRLYNGGKRPFGFKSDLANVLSWFDFDQSADLKKSN